MRGNLASLRSKDSFLSSCQACLLLQILGSARRTLATSPRKVPKESLVYLTGRCRLNKLVLLFTTTVVPLRLRVFYYTTLAAPSGRA
jgi:hypothetical protein